jgi:hypothetical protein
MKFVALLLACCGIVAGSSVAGCGDATIGGGAKTGSDARPASGMPDAGSEVALSAPPGDGGAATETAGGGGSGGGGGGGADARLDTATADLPVTGGAYTGVLAQLLGKTMFSSKSTGAATWLINGDTGSTQGQINSDMNAAGASKFPVFTFYRYYNGSGTDANAYRGWVTAAAQAIGSHSGGYAVVVLEPDSFALQNRSDVNDVLNTAIGIIKEKAPNAALFLDIGHSAWLSSGAVLMRAKGYSNYALIDGWASNTSNFQPTPQEETYAMQLFAGSGKPGIIDTSRNGLGRLPSTIINPPRSEWEPGAPFAWHPDKPGVYFNYHNKPWNEGD